MKVLLDLAKVAPWGIMKVLLDTILVILSYILVSLQNYLIATSHCHLC
jgi:hypothetical protein